MSLLATVEQIRDCTAASAHRHLLLIEIDGEDIESRAKVRHVTQQLYPDCLSIAGALTTDRSDRADRISRYLGTERQAVVFDASAHFDPGLLAAVASTVTAGGLMVILTRAFADWPTSFSGGDPHAQTVLPSSNVPRRPGRSRFIERFIRLFETANDQSDSLMTRLPVSSFTTTQPEPDAPLHPGAVDQPTFKKRSSALPDASWKLEQERLLLTLFDQLQTAESRVLVIEAARGRGKSSLLGRLAAKLDTCGTRWTLTSPRRTAVDAFERHWRIDASHESAIAPLPWVPTDQIPMQATDGANDSVLFVDEAADVPLPQLMAWTRQYAALVLSTTTAGYEGSGRGFVTRFYESLSRTATSWRRFTLKHPTRYGHGDPLEAFLNRVLLLDATAQTVQFDPSDIDVSQLQVSQLSQDELLEDEQGLATIFGLLREAHYQTTPMDLVHLLDAQALRLYAIRHSDCVLAVVMAAEEGQIEASLHEPILSGKRRLKDQLLPQLLARMANSPDALSFRYLRIVRIAVAARARRLGLGSFLVQRIEALTKGEFDAIGASYSRDDQTAAFWRHCRFKTFHEGFRAHPRSGYSTAAVVRSLTPNESENTEHGVDPMARIVTSACTILEANTAASDPAADMAVLSPGERSLSHRQLAWRFSQGARSYHDTRAALLHLWMADPNRGGSANLEALHAAACKQLPPHSSRKKREMAIREWAKNSLKHPTD